MEQILHICLIDIKVVSSGQDVNISSNKWRRLYLTVDFVMLFVLVELDVELISLMVQCDPIFVGIEGVTILFSSSPPDALCVKLGLGGVKESQDDATVT